MARLLNCPHCHAEFPFEDWAKAASCPACGQRLSFFEASAQAAPPDAGSDNGAAPAVPAAPAPAWAAAPGPAAPAPATPAPAAPAPAVPAHPASEAWDPLPDVRPASSVAAAGESATPADLWTWSAPDGAPPVDDAAPPAAGEAAAPVLPPVTGDTPPASVAPSPPPAAPPASVAPSPLPPPLASSLVAVPASSLVVAPPAGGHIYTIGGKALQWSRGWTVLVVVWAIVAVALVATRVDMGRLTVMTPGETAAIAAVKQIRLPTGAPTETVLRYSATHDLNLEGHIVQIKPRAAQMWYAFDRSWEHRIYVYYELPGVSLMGTNVDLSWSVTNGVATAGAATRVALAKAAQTMAHPPSPNSVRAVPGIIPSLPPDLQ